MCISIIKIYMTALEMCFSVSWKCTRIDLAGPESDQKTSNVIPTIGFHVYHLIARCAVPRCNNFNENKKFQLCEPTYDSKATTKLYTRKELVITDISFFEFHQNLYIPEIHKLALNLPHVQIIVNNHCGNKHQDAFTHREYWQDVLCRSNYPESLVSSFAHQIQYEYYGGNIYVSMETFYWNNQAQHKKEHNHHLWKLLNVMPCFNIFYMITSNKMQLQQPHIADKS